MPGAEAMRLALLAADAADDLSDDEVGGLARTARRDLPEAGALTILVDCPQRAGSAWTSLGESATAASLNEEVVRRSPRRPGAASTVPALRSRSGPEAEAASSSGGRAELGPRGRGHGLTLVSYAAAMLRNGLGRYKELPMRHSAARHIRRAAFDLSLPELVEAAVRSNQPALADDAMSGSRRPRAEAASDWRSGSRRARARSSAGIGATNAPIASDRSPWPYPCTRGVSPSGSALRRVAAPRGGRRVDAREQLAR